MRSSQNLLKVKRENSLEHTSESRRKILVILLSNSQSMNNPIKYPTRQLGQEANYLYALGTLAGRQCWEGLTGLASNMENSNRRDQQVSSKSFMGIAHFITELKSGHIYCTSRAI